MHCWILDTIETNFLVQSIESKQTVFFAVSFVMTLLLWRQVGYVYARNWVTDTNLWWRKFRNPASKSGGGLIELCLLPLRKRSMPYSVTFTKEGSKDLSPSTLPFPALRLFRSGDDRNAREANFHPKHRSKRTEFEEFQSNMISNKSRCEMKNNIL